MCRRGRLRDPKFDVVRFLGKTKETIPVILGAYLRGDSETLKSLGVVGDEMLERMQGQMSVWKKEGEVRSPHCRDTRARGSVTST